MVRKIFFILSHSAPTHPNEGLNHSQETSEEQDVPSYFALSELTRYELFLVIFYGGWHTVQSLLFLGLYLGICICVSLRGLMCFIRPLMRQLSK